MRQLALRKLPTKANRSSKHLKNKNEYAHHQCCFVGCTNTELDKKIHLSRIPPPPPSKSLTSEKDRKEKWCIYYKKKEQHSIHKQSWFEKR